MKTWMKVEQKTGCQMLLLYVVFPLNVSLLSRCPGASGRSVELACGLLRTRRHFPDSSRHGPHRLWLDKKKKKKEKTQSVCLEFLCVSTETPITLPVIELLGNTQVFEVVVYGPLILLKERVGVPQTVTGLSLHHLVPQLPGEL